MSIKSILRISLAILALFSCNHKKEITNLIRENINVGKDNIVAYQTKKIEIDYSKLNKKHLSKSSAVLIENNKHQIKKPLIIHCTKTLQNTIGKGIFTRPLKILAKLNSILAGKPEAILVKDAYNKDINPLNFSSFGKLQGLKNGTIRSLIQDMDGNIWMGTFGGGAIKYNGKYFYHFTEKEGLNKNTVWSIMQDTKGNIWFGTDQGACKYDGKYFTKITKADGLTDNTIWSILESKNGTIWFATNNGLTSYNGNYFYQYTTNQGLPSNEIEALVEDKKGNLWIACYGGGVCKFDGNTFTIFDKSNGLVDNKAISLLEDYDGNIWVGTHGGGLSKFNGVSFTNYTEKEGLLNNTIWSIKQDNQGNIWMGTFLGLCKFDNKKKYNTVNDSTTLTFYSEKEGLINNIVYSILQDRAGQLWFGTYSGICKYNGNNFHHFTEKEGLSKNTVWSINQDTKNNYWFGTYGGGVNLYDEKKFIHYNKESGLSSDKIFSIVTDKFGKIYLGTHNGGLNIIHNNSVTTINEKDGLINNTIYSMLIDSENNLWLGTNNGISKFDFKNITNYYFEHSIGQEVILCIIQDSKNNLWFGSDGGGLYKFDGENFYQFKKNNGLISNHINALFEDKEKNIWCGSVDKGVSKYSNNTFINYTIDDGLIDNSVIAINQTNDGSMLFGTHFGISKIADSAFYKYEKLKQPYIKSYTYEDGFLGIGCTGRAIYKDKKGIIWIGTNDKLTKFYPNSDFPDSIAPIVQLTGINLYNEEINWLDFEKNKDTSIQLSNGVTIENLKFDSLSKWYQVPQNLDLAYNNNFLTFNFVGIATKSPQKVKYKYQLVGFDKQWNTLTSKTDAPYGNLPPGPYIFKVKAQNSDGYWSREYSFHFNIRPPWWQTLPFKTAVIITLICSLILIYRWRTASLRLRQKELESKIIIATTEIRQQNEEILAQRDEIESQRDEIEAQRDLVIAQKNIIETKNKNITQSIKYANRIQESIFPTEEKLFHLFNDYFILHKPKDIVSGDFFWGEKIIDNSDNEIIVFAVVDCTGHGVPGAFMSFLAYNSLNHAVIENKLTNPSLILKYLNNYLWTIFKKDKNENTVTDGMDLFVCALNLQTKELKYAGVQNYAYIIRNNETITLKTQIASLGSNFITNENVFQCYQTKLATNDVIYLFSDGYIDQFGGNLNKRYSSKKFKDLLLNNHKNDLKEQQKILEKEFLQWKNHTEQYDDILILAIKI